MLWWFFLLFIILSISIKTPDAIRSAESIQENGLGYTSIQWQKSDTIAFVKSLAKDVKIYSNGSDVLGFLTENQSLSVPRKKFPTTLIANPGYTEEIGAMCKDIMENRAIIGVFQYDSGDRIYLLKKKLSQPAIFPFSSALRMEYVYGVK